MVCIIKIVSQHMLDTVHIETNTFQIENGNLECVLETTTQPESRKQHTATNGSLKQQVH